MIAPRTPPEPVIDAYCDWLTGIGGRVIHRRNRHGGYRVLHSPGNVLCVVVPDTQLEGILVSTMIEYLDGRLGLRSPWNQMPEAQEEAADD